MRATSKGCPGLGLDSEYDISSVQSHSRLIANVVPIGISWFTSTSTSKKNKRFNLKTNKLYKLLTSIVALSLAVHFKRFKDLLCTYVPKA